MDSAREQNKPEPPRQDKGTLNAGTPILTQPPTEAPRAPEGVPRHVVWIHRISMVVFVVFCIELGIFIAVLPWISVWNQNLFMLTHPAVRDFLTQNFVRGSISGLGVIDVWIGIWEAVHYHDPVVQLENETKTPSRR
ncbi:MAG TPA: hypothetical protein VKW78_15405 [Terriglobales bacterium]|nr:hypothetical protein [Terriglobales bacterium]